MNIFLIKIDGNEFYFIHSTKLDKIELMNMETKTIELSFNGMVEYNKFIQGKDIEVNNI